MSDMPTPKPEQPRRFDPRLPGEDQGVPDRPGNPDDDDRDDDLDETTDPRAEPGKPI